MCRLLRGSHTTPSRALVGVVAAAALSTSAVMTTAQTGRETSRRDVQSALAALWSAETSEDAARRGAQVLATGADFDALYARLQAGRPYTAQPTGVRQMPTRVSGAPLDNVLEVPTEYDPSRKWMLRVQLHGGVGRPRPERGAGNRPLTNRIPGEPQLTLHPRAWADSQWWTRPQVESILSLVERIKRLYNVDESRIYLTGISDGGTGVYYLAMRTPNPWAACLPLNGHPLVLANPDTGAEGELFIGNLVNCPLYLVNGGRDRLYPAASVAPFVDMMTRGGVPVVFQVYSEAGHDTSWWPVERPRFEAFVAGHARAAHPARLSWETDRTDRDNRMAWLVIDRLGRRPSDASLDDVNTFETAGGRRVPLYRRSGRSGRVDVIRSGNRFEARTRGVEQFTLLLSPDAVNFRQPVLVTVNGRQVFNGPVKADAAILLEWAARDNDRTRLYGAELTVRVP